MNTPDIVATARQMIARYGLKAQAVAMARAAEQVQQHDTAAHEQWEQIHAAICELRRTAVRPPEQPGGAKSAGRVA